MSLPSLRWLLLLAFLLLPQLSLAREVIQEDALGALVMESEEEGETESTLDGAYVKFVKPIDQDRLIPRSDLQVPEGCGAVDTASLLGFWQTEMGYEGFMDARDAFDGTSHPTYTIRRLYLDAKSFPVPMDLKGDFQSATLPGPLKRAVKKWVKRANDDRTKEQDALKAKRMTNLRSWKKRLDTLREKLDAGYPVILLLKNIPGSMRRDNVTSDGFLQWHYVVAVGYDNTSKQVHVISGWAELPKSSSDSHDRHVKRSAEDTDKAHLLISYDELKASKPGFIWIQPK